MNYLMERDVDSIGTTSEHQRTSVRVLFCLVRRSLYNGQFAVDVTLFQPFCHWFGIRNGRIPDSLST
jgi:hypothetical protein